MLDHVIVGHYVTVCGNDEARSCSLKFAFDTTSTGLARVTFEEMPVEVAEW
jgi:hypothetical protein